MSDDPQVSHFLGLPLNELLLREREREKTTRRKAWDRISQTHASNTPPQWSPLGDPQAYQDRVYINQKIMVGSQIMREEPKTVPQGHIPRSSPDTDNHQGQYPKDFQKAPDRVAGDLRGSARGHSGSSGWTSARKCGTLCKSSSSWEVWVWQQLDWLFSPLPIDQCSEEMGFKICFLMGYICL